MKTRVQKTFPTGHFTCKSLKEHWHCSQPLVSLTVKKSVAAGTLAVVDIVKSSGRGRPTTVYTVAAPQA
jgi:hypothetical protein